MTPKRRKTPLKDRPGDGADLESGTARSSLRRHDRLLADLECRGAMNALATTLAHDLNQPLAAVVNYARGCLLRLDAAEGAPRDVLGALERICEQADRADRILTALRGVAGLPPPALARADLNALVRAAAALVGEEFPGDGVEIRYDLVRDLPPVSVDPAQMELALRNVVRNGADATRTQPGARRLTLATARRDGIVEVTVGDTGPGVAAEAIERLFEPFFTTRTGRMGLGLAVSRAIVEAHGGRLWMRETSGQGTTFAMTLPAEGEAPTDDG